MKHINLDLKENFQTTGKGASKISQGVRIFSSKFCFKEENILPKELLGLKAGKRYKIV